jgi:hypothetical protein
METYASIERAKRAVLAAHGLNFPLKWYKHVDELQDMREGTFVRWVNLANRKLTNGGIVVVRNNLGRVFSFWADECLLFQKLTKQEHLMLDLLN